MQRAIHFEIYDRPPDPSFVFPHEGTELTFDIPIDSRPPWIPVLERHFQTRQEIFDVNEPPALAVMTWYLNRDVDYHCGAPCLVRLTDESFMWRTDCIFPWRNRLIRAVPADLVALQQLVATSADGPPRPHVIVTEGVPPENFAVLVTVLGTDGLQLPHRQFAHLFPGRVSGRDVLRLAVHADHVHRPVIIQLDGQTYFSDDTIVLQSGSSLLVLVSGADIDIYSEQIADGFSLMQQKVTRSWMPRVCKPANHERPDDFPVSIVSNRVQRPIRPYHDGEPSWTIDLGRLFPLFGEYNAWDEETSILVTSWYIHHMRRPACHRHKMIRLVNNPLSWVEDIRNTWQDLLDRSRPFTIRIVRPRPPQFREHQSPCHIIVEQAPIVGKVVAILTALIEGTPNDAIIQSAYSLDQRVNTATIIRTMDITRFCAGRECALYYDRQAVPGLDWIEVQSGSSLYIRIRNVIAASETLALDNETHQHFADLSLMQSSTFVFNPNATEFTPGQPAITTQPEHLQDLQVCWNSGAFAWEEESRALHILTWFVAPGRGILRCLYGRRVTLYEDFRQWEVTMKTKWTDLIDPHAPVSFVVVSPAPPHLEPSIGAHVLLIQNEIPSSSSPLVTIYDTAINYGSPFRVVITLGETSTANDIITALEYEDDCQTVGTTCTIWFERNRIPQSSQIAIRDGNCIALQVNRIVLPANWRPPILPKPIGAEGFSLLQTRIDIQKRHETAVIDLEAALFPNTLVPVNLIHVGDCSIPQTFPSHVLVEDGFSDLEVEQAIAEFRLSYHAHVLYATGAAFVTPVDWKCNNEAWHLVYFPLHFQDRSEIILHRSALEPTEHDHMVFLHSLGFTRAVVLQVQRPKQGLLLIQYHNNIPSLEGLPTITKKQTAWPSHQPVRRHSVMFQKPTHVSAPSKYLIEWKVTPDELSEFFHSGLQTLCPWYSHFQLPDFVQDALTQHAGLEGHHVSFSTFDRLIIYTDGSSKAHNRRKAPLWVQEFDVPDAWSFVVLGEKYGTPTRPSTIQFLGWHAQQVLYETHLPHFAGSDAIGSEHAEREALLWAGVWRLGINSTIPTIFRTDSSTTGDHASGRVSCPSQHPAFIALRSTFQALTAGLGPDELRVEHVAGHAGDPWNEFADFLAKTESTIGHKLCRQQVDIQKWRPLLPFFWMLFDQNAGLPPFTPSGFAIQPPDAPCGDPHPDATTAHPGQHSAVRAEFFLSVASLNIGSLFVGPDGHAGKLQFVREQMKSLHLNFLGLQETRSPACLSLADDVIRLSGGALQGKYGTELWINTQQPICHIQGKPKFIKRSNVQVVHADPRRLFVRIESPELQFFVTVLHAPQSGRPLDERKQWWTRTNELVDALQKDIPVLVLLDANAKSGPRCPPTVFENDDVISASTPFFLEFLQQHELCLPCTSSIHVGTNSTWISPDGLTQHRIDFIAVPQTWSSCCVYSCTLPELDTGNSHDDHTAVALQMRWSDYAVHSDHLNNRRPRHNRRVIGKMRQAVDLSHVTVAPWSADIETQVTSINRQLGQILEESCPAKKGIAKKPFFDAELWACRVEKQKLRKRLQQAAGHKRRLLLRCIFLHWQRPERDAETWRLHHNYVVSNLCVELKLRCHYVSIARALKQRLRRAKQNALRRELEDISEKTAAGEIIQRIRPHIGPSNPKKAKRACLPIVKDKNGLICPTPHAAQNRWIEFFQLMEGGTRMSHDEYREKWIANLRKFLQIPDMTVSITELPTLVDLEMAFHRVAIGKATGIDDIPPELCRYKATEMARISYAIMLKACLYGQEAAEHKGGKLAIAWKHKGDPADCSSHRSLLISSHFGKTIHRALRQKHHSLYTCFMQSQQLGGRPFMPVGVPLHMARAFMRWQQRLHRSTSLIFLDLTEAFYRVVRPLALGGDFSDEHIACMAQALGYDESTLRQFHQQLSQPSALQEAGAPAHVQRFMQALHTDTWFTIGDQTDLVRTEQGSRPGDSYADVVFGLLWAKLLKTYEQRLVEAGMLMSIPDIARPSLFTPDSEGHPQIALLGPTWMDDLCVCLCASSNGALIERTGYALSLLIDLCKSMHMQPNLRKRKTEIMFCFRGQGSRQFRRQFYSHAQGFPVVCDDATYHVNVVSRYLHLGGVIHHRVVNRAEITRRLGIAHQAFSQHRRVLYRNLSLSWSKRKELFGSLILSKLVYGFESWTFETQQIRAQIHAGIIKLYKRLLGHQHAMHLSDEQVLVETGLPSPTELLRGCRLRYFGTLFNCQHASHWGLLVEDRQWIALLEDDFQWLWAQLKHNTTLPDPVSHFAVWQGILIHHKGYWKKLIKKGLTHACLQRENHAVAVQLHQRVATLLHKHGWVSHLPNEDVPIHSPSAIFGCMCCGTAHATKAGESAHMFKRHGYRASARSLFDGTACPHCLREYHTRAKVLAHLRHAHTCRQSLIGRRIRCPVMPGTGSIVDQALSEQIDGTLPFQDGHGPKFPADTRHDFETYDVQMFESIYLYLVDYDGPGGTDLQSKLADLICAQPISWTVCHATLAHFLETFTCADAEPLSVSFDQVVACIGFLMQSDSWPFLQGNAQTESLSQVRLDQWEEWFAEHAVNPQYAWDTAGKVPRVFGKHKIVLHAYAGRRRRGDIEWYMLEIAKLHPDHIIMTASVDIIIDSVYGDIARPETRDYWLFHIANGHVAGFIAGPPCNTWSKARNIQIPGHVGPRVVRTPLEPWGLASLRLGEIRQVSIGSLLLGFAFECLTALAMCAGAGLLEHPKDPEDPELVSIWRLPILRMILTLPGMRLISLSQGLFGAATAKPTTFLVLGLPTLEMDLHGGRLSPHLPHGASIGKDSSGQYRTAPLKEYPPALCRAIALSFCKDFASIECSDTAPPSEFVTKCIEMSGDQLDGHIGHDG